LPPKPTDINGRQRDGEEGVCGQVSALMRLSYLIEFGRKTRQGKPGKENLRPVHDNLTIPYQHSFVEL
jgi:hypothetical protein